MMAQARRLHKTARGIIVRNGSVLVMQATGSPRCGLPGGHIDAGEQAIDALIREIREELGAELGYVEWLAKITDRWDDGVTQEEMDLYAVITWPTTTLLTAREPHLRTRWVQWYAVEEVNLRPRAVYPWIARVVARGQS